MRRSTTSEIMALLRHAQAGQQIRVMVHLNATKTLYARLPLTNEPGGERASVFACEVASLLHDAGGDPPSSIVVSMAANLGVATIEAPVEVVRRLQSDARLRSILRARLLLNDAEAMP